MAGRRLCLVVRIAPNMKILRRNSIIYILLLFIACDRINDNQDPYTALVRLHSRTDYNGYVIIEADGTDKYIQFI